MVGAKSKGPANGKEPDTAASHPDRNVYEAAKERVAAVFGLPAGELSGPETFNLCLAIAGSKASAYRTFVALRDMVRGLGLATTVRLISRSWLSPWLA